MATWKVRIVVGGLGVASAALYAVGTGFSVPWLSPAIARLGGEAGRSVGEDPRLRIWRRAVDIWSDQPVFGVGIGQFGRFTIDVNGYDEHDVGQIAHNTFLSFFLVESGILGLVLCVGGMAFLVFRLLLDRRIEGRLRYALGLGGLRNLHRDVHTEFFSERSVHVGVYWLDLGGVYSMAREGGRIPAHTSYYTKNTMSTRRIPCRLAHDMPRGNTQALSRSSFIATCEVFRKGRNGTFQSDCWTVSLS